MLWHICEVVEVLPSCNRFCGILVSYSLLLLFFIVYVNGQNLVPPDICNILKNKINFIWKKILVMYIFTGLKNNLNHEKISDENTPVESPLAPFQKNHFCLPFCLNLIPLILVLGTLSHCLIWMEMMVMLDLNFPFFFRAWGWKSEEYGALINKEFLSFCHWNYKSKRRVDQRWLAFIIRDLDVTFLNLYLQQLQNRCHSTDVWWACACALSLHRACMRMHTHTHTRAHTHKGMLNRGFVIALWWVW
jgi:hypothetical protein